MQTADYALSSTIPTAARLRVVDFPASHFSGGFSTIVPYPNGKFNIAASVKPLSYEVLRNCFFKNCLICFYVSNLYYSFIGLGRNWDRHVGIVSKSQLLALAIRKECTN